MLSCTFFYFKVLHKLLLFATIFYLLLLCMYNLPTKIRWIQIMYLGVKPLGNNYISITNFDLQRIEFIFAAT